MGLCASKAPQPQQPSSLRKHESSNEQRSGKQSGDSSRAVMFHTDVKQSLADPALSPATTRPGHERGRSVTGGLTRTNSTTSADSNPSDKRKSQSFRKSGSTTEVQSPTAKRNSGLSESLIAFNSTSTNVREFYDGLDEDNSILGTGNWGVVKVVTRKRDGKKFACKIVKLDENMTEEQFEELRAEIDALRQLDHVAIAKLFETFEEPGHRLYLVMELLTGGELYTALVERSPTGRFDEIRTRKLARRMVSSIAYLHDRGLVHRDIKLENFCFRGDESEDEIVLIDFGLAKLYEMKASMTEVVGSSYYIAPEIVEGSYSGPTPDMWSLGVILFMMLSGRPPFDGNSDANIMRRTIKGRFSMDDEVWRNQVSTLAQDFVRRCLTRDPASRMTSKEALRHTWLTASDEALIDAGAGDDPARALAPALSTTEKRMSQQAEKRASATRRISATIGEAVEDAVRKLSGAGRRISNTLGFAEKPDVAALECLRKFAGRHELVQLFTQAVAYSLGRDELKEQVKLFVRLDRNSDGFITVGDIEVGLLGAPPNEVIEEASSPRGSYAETPRGAKGPSTFGLSLMGQDDATRVRRRRRREANYLFASMDISKHAKVSLNEFLAATLDTGVFFKDEKLLADAFSRIHGDASGTKGSITVGSLQPMMGKRYTERKAKRLIGEFVAAARLNPADVAKLLKKKSAGNIKSPTPDIDDESVHVAGDVSPRRIDVERIEFGDFVKGLQQA